MFTKEFFEFLGKIITSWQVIVVSVVLVIYFSLVSYVARIHHHRRWSFHSKSKKDKPQKVTEELLTGSDDDDSLGLE